MEKEKLLQDDQDQNQALPRLAKEDEHPHTPLPIFTLRACALLLLASTCLNCALVWLLAGKQYASHDRSEYGQSVDSEKGVRSI